METEQAELTLNELLSLPHHSGVDKQSELPRGIIMSEFSEKELHRLIKLYRFFKLPGQLWATLTPTSEN